MSEITFIGLGAMGSAIARVLLEKHCDVTVWNRSEGKADKLVSLGAKKAQTINEAIDASPRIFICIDSYSSTSKLLEEERVSLLLQGKTLVQMSTGTPSEAKEAEAWLEKHGGKFLATTIMGYPSSIGKPEAQFLVAGPDKIFQDCEHYLKLLGHDIRYLGSNIGAAAALNLAIIGRFVANSISIIHGANVCESEGVDLEQYSNMYPQGDRARSLIQSIRTNNFDMDGGVSVEVAADCAASMQSQAREIGINSEFPDFILSPLQRAIDAGYRDEDTSAQIKILRRDINN